VRNKFCHLFLTAGLTVLSASHVTAAPPSSCAQKFIGTWVYPGGTTVVAPGGTAYPKCPMCVPTQSWTCQGNTYLFSNSGPPGQFSATLSADGRQLIGSGSVATRVGGAARGGGNAPAKELEASETKAKANKKVAVQQPTQLNNATAKSASCSDITGTGGGTPGASHCKDADRALYAARQVQQSSPQLAAAEYKKAAAAARRAGDNNLELSILREAAEATAPAAAVANAPNPSAADAGQTQNSGAADGQDATVGDKIIPTPCQDLTGKFGCRDDRNLGSLERDARLSQGKTERLDRPRPWSPDSITPDFTAAIMQLADAILDADGRKDGDGKARERLKEQVRHALQRRMADHRAPLKSEDRACLQPVNGPGPRLLDIPLRWHPYHIKKEAIDQSHLCDGVPEGEAKDDCREAKYGQAVMWAEPELAGQCRGAGDLAEVAECAKRKFLNAWPKNDGVVQTPAPVRWTMPASCNPTGTLAQRKNTLRERLRERLAAAQDSKEVPRQDGKPAAMSSETTRAADDEAPPPPPPLADSDEAYCSYMARAVIRGELTSGGSTSIPTECKASIAAAEALKTRQQKEGPPPFTWSDVDADREIARLVQATK
jgi:hypothetical protein